MLKVIILEDEPVSATELKRMLNSLKRNLSVVKILPSIKETISWLKCNEQPDLIFSDIVLNDGICFNIFNELNISCPVIFCTGYENYAVEAFRNNGVDYLLKPFGVSDIERSLIKLETLQNPYNNSTIIRKLQEKLIKRSDNLYQNTILCHFREQIIPLPTDVIKYISTENRSVRVFTDSNSYLIKDTMDRLIRILNPYKFFRANRKYIIHRSAIKSIKTALDRKLKISLSVPNSPTISIGKEKASAFKTWLTDA